MSQKEHSRAHRSRTYKRVRGVILILLVLGIIWGITALVRHNAAQPDPTPDPNAGQQTPGRTATIATTVYQLWRTNDEAGAMRWVLVDIVISAVVLLAVNLLEKKQKAGGRA